MPFYLLFLLAWFGVAFVAAVLMGRFIVAGRGERDLREESVAAKARGIAGQAAVGRPRGTRDAA
jgi:hypothetical protein